MSGQSFYERLPSFNDFNEIASDAHFKAVPSDWGIIITDVRGSTRAIEEGRYKEVNMIGVASIVVARKAMKGRDLPFVFGGDGATLLVEPDQKDAVLHDLCALRELATARFALDLRIGYVAIAELYALGLTLDAAKYRLVDGKHLAVLRGSGMKMAEAWIKGNDAAHEVHIQTRKSVSLESLSCRWQPIPSRKGKVLSMLVLSRTAGSATYRDVLARLDKVFPEGMEASNPVNVDLMRYKSVRECLRAERNLDASGFSISCTLRLLEIIAAVLVFKFRVPPLFFNPQRYAQAMRTHSDFRKFDDMLKMVIDCSASQRDEVKAFLQHLHEAGVIYYGLFEADNSIMTCYVDSLNDGGHIHFIDADNGGYAAAAVELKKQMQRDTATM